MKNIINNLGLRYGLQFIVYRYCIERIIYRWFYVMKLDENKGLSINKLAGFSVKAVGELNDIIEQDIKVLGLNMTYDNISNLRMKIDNNNVLWLGYLDQVLVTYCWSSIGEARSEIPIGNEDAYILDVETFASSRSKGIGAALICHVSNELMKGSARQVWAAVHVMNEKSFRMFTRAGFKCSQRVRLN